MASKALKLRVKAEAGERDESAGILSAKTRDDNDAAASCLPSLGVQNLLEVPPEKACCVCFPPGTSILYTDMRTLPIVISKGTVQAVFIDLAPGSVRDFLYKIALDYSNNPFIVRGKELQYAPHCLVWLQLTPENSDKKRAIIVGSYQGVQNAAPLYSVQQEADSSIYHGVTKDHLQYRSESNDGWQDVVVASGMTESFQSTVEHPVSVSSASLPNATQAEQEDLNDIKTPAPRNGNVTLIASRVTSSPRKRPSSSSNSTMASTDAFRNETASNDTFRNDATMGQCTAEFTMPYWMKHHCLNSDFIQQMCQIVKQCADCRGNVLESSPRAIGKTQSIFIYGRDMRSVEYACEIVSDLLKKYFRRRDRRKLASDLKNGWRKRYNHEESNIATGVLTNEELEPVCLEPKAPSNATKKAKKEQSPPKEGETESETMYIESDSKMLFQKHKDASEDRTEDVITTSRAETADTLPAVKSLSQFLPKTESEEGKKGILPTLQPLSDISGWENELMIKQEPLMSNGNEDLDVKQEPMTRTIRVPLFANEHYVKEALIGEGEKKRSNLLQETGCYIQLNMPDLGNNAIEAVLSGASDGDFDFAQLWVENRIVSTVPDDQKGRMLFHLAKDNNYGECEGLARYQRSPYDLRSWVWMYVIDLPADYDRLYGLFLDKHGKGVKAIIKNTGCQYIALSESFPKHVFVCSPNLDMVNEAIKKVNDRVLWTLSEAKDRRKEGGSKRW